MFIWLHGRFILKTEVQEVLKEYKKAEIGVHGNGHSLIACD